MVACHWQGRRSPASKKPRHSYPNGAKSTEALSGNAIPPQGTDLLPWIRFRSLSDSQQKPRRERANGAEFAEALWGQRASVQSIF